MVISTLRSGTFRIEPGLQKMSWSPELYELFGFTPGEVVPTVPLLLRHLPVGDRDEWTAALTRCAVGEPMRLWHGIVTGAGREHTVLTTAQPHSDGAAVIGQLTDLTEALRRESAERVTEAISRAADTRAVIEQAKGVLMAALDLDAEQAFDLLRWHSSHSNVKLRDVCTAIVTQLSSPERQGPPTRQRLAAILGELSEREPDLTRLAALAWIRSQPSAPESPGNRTSLIPEALLPRTLARAVDAAAVSISIVDCDRPDWPLVYVNPAFEKLTGYSAAEVVGRNCRFLQGELTGPEQKTALREVLQQGRDVRALLHNVRRNGQSFWNELLLSPVRNGQGRLTHYIGYQADVSERVERDHQLDRLVHPGDGAGTDGAGTDGAGTGGTRLDGRGQHDAGPGGRDVSRIDAIRAPVGPGAHS